MLRAVVIFICKMSCSTEITLRNILKYGRLFLLGMTGMLGPFTVNVAFCLELFRQVKEPRLVIILTNF